MGKARANSTAPWDLEALRIKLPVGGEEIGYMVYIFPEFLT